MIPNENSPFNLNNDNAYQAWRERKLNNANTQQKHTFIKIKKTPPHFCTVFPEDKTESSVYDGFPIEEILAECATNNYCLYKIESSLTDSDLNQNPDKIKSLIHRLAKACGINHLDNNICADSDSLTSIYQKNKQDKQQESRGYIPYTNKKLSWHNDGYYNSPDKTIHSMLLHCYQEAMSGGESAFIDHDIVYILLRDKNPDWIKALSDNHVLTIPANILNDVVIRAEQTGPVFSVTSQGLLHMRYTARTKSIVWKKNKKTLDAVDYIKALLDLNSPYENSKYIVKHKFKAGEGIISRNILHCRTGFEDDASSVNQRLLFRGRFYDELPKSQHQ